MGDAELTISKPAIEAETPTSTEGLRFDVDTELLNALLRDRTTHKNILWGTDDYSYLGEGYEKFSEIKPGLDIDAIQPRVMKPHTTRADRTKDKAEVFTPSWVCNQQNNLIDEQWFKRPNVFNKEQDRGWIATAEKIVFNNGASWEEYVDERRLEVSCGEAPYLVSRYDTVTGKGIPLMERIGLLDRKMRVVQENAVEPEEWLKWSQRAFESIYGFEYQGDNLLIARKNLLFTYIDYYVDRFQEEPSLDLLKQIAHIITWNIWQMDGLSLVVPGSCKPLDNEQVSIFDFLEDDLPEANEQPMCPGCKKGNIWEHTGTYCKIMDWRSEHSCTYLSMLEKGQNYEL